MTDAESLQEHHHKFSAAAHNQAADILYSENPEQDETDRLIELAHVAYWHWTQRTDKQPQNISVALWVLSRAYSANGFGDKALGYAQHSLATIENEYLLPSFYGYSHEALARAYLLLGDNVRAEESLTTARSFLERVPNPQAKEYLQSQIEGVLSGTKSS